MNPELNYKINFNRVFSAFWQENQGLGLLGGHGFAAVLPHNIAIFILDMFYSARDIRAIFTFLMLLSGGLGIFFFLLYILHRLFISEHMTAIRIYPTIEAASLIGSIFYMLNLGTVMMFYIQLEAFIVHYAALPWLLFTFIRYLDNPGRLNLFWLIFISFWTSTQGFIPPLFVGIMFSLLIIAVCYLLYHQSRRSIKTVIIAFSGVILSNIYWIIPLAYYTVTQSSIYLNSYNNVISTPEFLDKNLKYGNIINVPLLRGFVWEALDSVREGVNVFVFQPWIDHHHNILVLTIGYISFIAVCAGVFSIFKEKRKSYLGLALTGILLFYLTGLTTNFPPFSFLTWILQHMPIYRQAFRAAFTKFSLGTAFSYSIFVSIAVAQLLSYLHKIIENKHKYNSRATILTGIIIISLIFYALPAFFGNFLYHRLKLDLPEAYQEIMSFFKTQDPASRIANLPQDCPAGWTNYSWGYTGSGFYWYGIEQPVMDRAFDVWSNQNEKYFWELQDLLRNRNYPELDKFWQKYDMKWLLYDPNYLHCKNAKGFLQFSDYINYLEHNQKYKRVKTFTGSNLAPIYLYEIQDNLPQKFIEIKSNVPNIGPSYMWANKDQAFAEFGTYISDGSKSFDAYFPFRTLFTKRGTFDREFIIEETPDSLYISNLIDADLTGYRLQLPNYFNIDSMTFVHMILSPTNQQDEYLLTAEFRPPEIYLDKTQIYGGSHSVDRIDIAKLNLNQVQEMRIVLHEREFKISKPIDKASIFAIGISNKNPNFFRIYDQDNNLILDTFINPSEILGSLPKTTLDIKERFTKISVRIPKLYDPLFVYDFTNQLFNNKPYPCNEITPSNRNKSEVTTDKDGKPFLRLLSKQSRQCLSFNMEEINHDLGLIIGVDGRNISGRDPSLYVTNHLTESTDLDVYLNLNNQMRPYYYIIPPTYSYGFGRTIYLDSYSLNSKSTENHFSRLVVWPLPYNFLTQMKFAVNPNPATTNDSIKSVDHPSPSLYKVMFEPSLDYQTLILYQSHSRDWHAYEIENPDNSINIYLPFLFGRKLDNHVLVNNWANGWRLEPSANPAPRTIVLIFMPQLLQYIGFGLLPLVLGLVLWQKASKHT